jgi:hypothetical protein
MWLSFARARGRRRASSPDLFASSDFRSFRVLMPNAVLAVQKFNNFSVSLREMKL